ncbi:uncharacterized protein PHACADRAFT_250789 [Phanerochaete carnosa HHB-10118-sp]|uniref:Uncharacterized protein n=1 Tax=Phanerochaete carnosa (strain HHB-10118-sp) TaxID=650164 RepID=K5XAL1_PHACS|nr:uncharacterized protein PHACADRAFT_250789 [Phanerochaete carnosa HHB-10118-sp]EKM59967.1 hypothetical protein PHACADRAFT_250789 [Phanerochaete carnosa HHB-10118-sp]
MQLRPWELSYPPASSDIPSPPTTSSGKKSRRMSMSSAGSMRKDSEVIELFELPSVPSGVLEEQCESTDEILELPRADGDVGPSTSRLPPHGLSPIITNGYRDSWDLPSLPTQSASPTLPISDPQQHKLQHRKSKFSLLSKRSRHDAPYSVPPTPTLSTRARVFGPERVVLDPRIREVHKRVLRDILLSGFVLGTTLTVVVLALPHAR